jgi:phosphoribosyl-ATP pyrophosphohydrolase/phosphoribosyl-AMP cyclohydrolase
VPGRTNPPTGRALPSPVRVAQKVAEEGLEVALSAVSGNDGAVVNESADLLFHLLLLSSRGQSLTDVVEKLESRHTSRSSLSTA